MVGYLILGDVIVAALYQSGTFGASDTFVTYVVLAGYALGLPAATSTRLFSSAFFALRDTRTPAKVAAARVVLAAGMGAALMFPLDRLALQGHALGALGLSLAAGAAAWVEWLLLRRALLSRVGPAGAGAGTLAKMFTAAALAALAGRGVLVVLPPVHPILAAAVALSVYGAGYFAIAALLGLAEAREIFARLRR